MKKYLLLVLVAFVFSSCKPTRESRLKEIGKYEMTTLKETKEISKIKADSLLVLYDSFISDFPTDSNSTIFLFRAADVCINMKYCDRAIAYIDRLVSDFPNTQMSEFASFKRGEAYEKACSNKEKAKQAYDDFTVEYPESDLANTAKVMSEMLGMQDEMDMIRQFEAQNAETLTVEN